MLGVDHNQIQDERSTGLGGTDAAVVLGLSPWKSRFSLWAEKIGLEEPPDFKGNERVEWGLILEPVIAREYARRTGHVIKPGRRFRRHPTKKHMICHVDRMIESGKLGSGVLEIKTAGAEKKGEWQDGPPLHYQVQLFHNMTVTGSNWGAIAVLVGGSKFFHYTFHRRDAIERDLIQLEEEFWVDHVLAREPPEEVEAPDLGLLGRMVDIDQSEIVVLPPEVLELDEKYYQLDDIIKTGRKAQAEQKKIKAEIARLMMGKQVGVLPGGGRWEWSQQERSGYTVEPQTIRQFRRKKA